MALDGDRRAQLERTRAEALLRSCFDVDVDRLDLEAAPFGVIARRDDCAWIVSMRDDLAILGGVLVWLDRHPADRVDLIVDHHGGIHARRAEMLAPQCRVWATAGARVHRAGSEPIPPPRPRPEMPALEAVMLDLGLEVVCEDGILRGEVAGLEVARIVPGPDGPVLEAGVGRFDREAAALLHGGRAPEDAVADAAEQVRPHRTVGAASHAVNRLARERWLRSLLVADPRPVGVGSPRLVEPVPARRNLLEATPAALMGMEGDRRVLVICSVGVDLGLVPATADLVAAHAPDRVRLVVPERDRMPHLERLIARLPLPADIVTIAPPWID